MLCHWVCSLWHSKGSHYLHFHGQALSWAAWSWTQRQADWHFKILGSHQPTNTASHRGRLESSAFVLLMYFFLLPLWKWTHFMFWSVLNLNVLCVKLCRTLLRLYVGISSTWHFISQVAMYQIFLGHTTAQSKQSHFLWSLVELVIGPMGGDQLCVAALALPIRVAVVFTLLCYVLWL